MLCHKCNQEGSEQWPIPLCISCIRKIVSEEQKTAYLFQVHKFNKPKPNYAFVVGTDALNEYRDNVEMEDGVFLGVIRKIAPDDLSLTDK